MSCAPSPRGVQISRARRRGHVRAGDDRPHRDGLAQGRGAVTGAPTLPPLRGGPLPPPQAGEGFSARLPPLPAGEGRGGGYRRGALGAALIVLAVLTLAYFALPA